MSAIMGSSGSVIVDAGERGQTLELIRGLDAAFLARFSPLVQQESITLDLGTVERIDAAGLAALIALYRAAVASGHSFAVIHPRPRIRQILALVGLDQVLLANGGEEPPSFHSRPERSAA